MNHYFRNAIITGCLLSLTQPGVAGNGPKEPKGPGQELTVRVYNYEGVPKGILQRAQDIAARTFESAGVRLEWTACPVEAGTGHQYPGCARQMGKRDVILRILPAAPQSRAKQGDVFGVALIPLTGRPGKFASIYFDRVEQATWKSLKGSTDGIFAKSFPSSLCTSITLGMVMAHELGHLLLGANSHSKRGVMRSSWNRGDLEDAFFGRQTFTDRQAKRIRANLLGREQLASTGR
jgi:hypothetical protein